MFFKRKSVLKYTIAYKKMSRIVSLWDEITWVSKIWAIYGTGLVLNKH
jgi:hypothetical protein